MQHINAAAAPRPGGPYSHAVVSGRLAFLAGQRPIEPATGELVEGIEEQTRQVLTNLGAVLQAIGVGFESVVRTNVYLNDIGDFDAVNAVYREFFMEPFPARTTVAAHLRGILVEIDAVAELPDGAESA